MSRRKIPKATHEGKLKIGETEIDCAVLEDGTRLLTQQGFLKAMGRARAAKGGHGASVAKMPAFLAAKNLIPFISDELIKSTTPIPFRTIKGVRAYGYNAELLPKICQVYLEARDAKKLYPTQKHIAVKADILIRGLAHVGIVAMVDEATGYQYERDRDELHKILEAYIAKELLPWTKRFPDEFYRQLFRLRGWSYSPLTVKRPQYVGKLTNQLIYEKLPTGVLGELRKKNPVTPRGYRKHRHHQFLTEHIGNPHLEKHLASVTTLMRASANWRNFERLFKRAFWQKGDQLQLDFENDLDE